MLPHATDIKTTWKAVRIQELKNPNPTFSSSYKPNEMERYRHKKKPYTYQEKNFKKP